MLHLFACCQKLLAIKKFGQVLFALAPAQSHPSFMTVEIRRSSCHTAQLNIDQAPSTTTPGFEKAESLAAMPDGPDPYLYTSGRWLNRDRLQRDARVVNFNFPALCEKVIALCPGAIEIQSFEKKEGGFNRVFIFQMDNGKRIVARIPFSNSWPGNAHHQFGSCNNGLQ